MAIPEITKLTFRHGTEADLNAVNPVLADGEPVFCADGNILKIGDGVMRYSELPRLYAYVDTAPVLDVFGIIDTGRRTEDGAVLAYIDENFNVIENMNPKQFEEHAAFKFTTETDNAGNEWVRVPKCYTKRGLAPSGQYAGNQYFLISPTEKDGFSLSPAFKDMGVEKDSFAVSAYKIANDGSNNPVSKAGMANWTNIVFGDAQNQCAKLGHMYDIYKHSHIAFLAAVEKNTFNVIPMADRAVREKCEYRGIHDFCYGVGTYQEWLDGIATNSSYYLMIWDINGNRNLTNTNKRNTTTSGYIKELYNGDVFDYLFIPSVFVNSQSNSFIPNNFNFRGPSSVSKLRFKSNILDQGAFSVYAYANPVDMDSNTGFRAAKY